MVAGINVEGHQVWLLSPGIPATMSAEGTVGIGYSACGVRVHRLKEKVKKIANEL